MSETVTSKLQASVSPPLSVAVSVTVVVPNGKVSPGLSVEVKVAMPQLSLAFGAAHKTFAPQTPGSVLTAMLAGLKP